MAGDKTVPEQIGKETLRVLVISHGHPALSLGGAEVASYNLHQGLKAVPGSQSFYLARVGNAHPRHGKSALMGVADADDELFYHADDYDPFLMSNRNTADLESDLRRFVRSLDPDVVHFHHFIGFGLESLHIIRDVLPSVSIFVTLHEFLPICFHHGQMVKTGSHDLCRQASPIACHGCFPEISPGSFVRRKHFIQSMLRLADGFVTPSRFLAERYQEWGLPGDRISVIENGLSIDERAEPRRLKGGADRRSRFAFFGQMTPYKGVDVLLDAVQRIPDALWKDDASLTIFGGNLDWQPDPFRKKIEELLEKAGLRVRFAGAYQNKDMPALMRQVDWVLVPSVWWENSPVIIQEAFFHGRPVICSGVGGMAEKVRDGVDGLHFLGGSPEDLSDRLCEALEDRDLWDTLRKGIPQPQDYVSCAQEHLSLYRAVGSSRMSPTAALPNNLKQSA
ncbi:glycosyltransferase family 4 protein [Roseibium sp. MMSF_3544]|uniref:glycosyltransferase family 4 protein n=1 Tax=unclassified Roseibium TaxID=2629323 RepID=UPI002740180D|nr:glycosyltransferase family 4 protein [Roseibium sp. MMSF_3544]